MAEDNEADFYTVKARCHLLHAAKNAAMASECAFEHRESLSFVGNAMRNLALAEACLQIALAEENESKKGGHNGRLAD